MGAVIQIVEDAHGGKMEKKNKTNKHCLINVIYITIKTVFGTQDLAAK